LQHCVIDLGGGVLQAGPNVRGLQIGKVGQNLRFTGPTGEHVEDILDPYAHVPNAGASAALFGIKRDAVEVAHTLTLSDASGIGKFSFVRGHHAEL
jgi:hypothetical protein